MSKTEIILRTSSVKLKAGFYESAVISWNTHDAEITTLNLPCTPPLFVNTKGRYRVYPQKTTTYRIEAIFSNGEKQTKSITIEVLQQAVFSFDVIEHIDRDNISAEVTWSIKNASNITLDGQKVESSGFKSCLIDWPDSRIFKYDDAFGSHKKVIHIAKRTKSPWILVDTIKLLLRPFTFVGYVGKIEFWWSLLLIVLALSIIVIPRALQIDYDYDLSLFRSEYFLRGYRNVFVCLYLLIMLLAKRMKDIGKKPRQVFCFLPVVLYPLLPQYLTINASTEEFYSTSLVIFVSLLVIMVIIIYTVGIEDSKRKIKYKKIHVW